MTDLRPEKRCNKADILYQFAVRARTPRRPIYTIHYTLHTLPGFIHASLPAGGLSYDSCPLAWSADRFSMWNRFRGSFQFRQVVGDQHPGQSFTAGFRFQDAGAYAAS